MMNEGLLEVPIHTVRGRWIQSIRKKQLRKKKFSIIANNCWGFQIYQWLDLPYQTPFVGCGAYPPCYLKLLTDLEYYLKQGFSSFVKESKYFHGVSPWPIGILGGDIEIHFAHYRSEVEAEVAWNKRLQRMSWNRDDIYVKICDRDTCSYEDLTNFHSLPFKHKISFTAKAHPELKDNIQIKMPSEELQVMRADYLFKEADKYFDVFHWINEGEIKMTPLQRCANLILGK